MTLDERCKKYRNEARRYKRKFLILRLMFSKIFKEILECSYDIDNYDGIVSSVVDVNDVLYAIDKYTDTVTHNE